MGMSAVISIATSKYMFIFDLNRASRGPMLWIYSRSNGALQMKPTFDAYFQVQSKTNQPAILATISVMDGRTYISASTLTIAPYKRWVSHPGNTLPTSRITRRQYFPFHLY
ncbi:hypothetical protein RF11_05889 [Thelohanellus kitauei]|uniref:Uncharacterized protein n=1 Tax=Thelohanellus kitauei TaxID=669202 RepID=A0A0C2MBN0_THEKT|nr:hypothetical protein RF11_05889 [Thelohanellus kitauei]